MKDRPIKNDTQTQTDWARFHNMTDEDIEKTALSDPDSQPTDEDFWSDAEMVFPVSDQEVVVWFRKTYGKDYQKKMYDVLKTYMETQHVS